MKVRSSSDRLKEEVLRLLKESPSINFNHICRNLNVAPLVIDMLLLTDKNFDRQVQSYIDTREGRIGS